MALCDFLAAAAMLQLTAVRTDLRGGLYAVTWGVCQGIRGTAYGTIVGDDCMATIGPSRDRCGFAACVV